MTPPAGECDCTLFVEYLQDMIDGFRALSQDEEKVFISSTIIFSLMFAEYIQAAMEKATYEIIDDPEPFYGEVPELQGLWATGKTLEECRKNLMEALEDWIAAHLAWGYPIPPLGGHIIQVSKEPMAVAD